MFKKMEEWIDPSDVVSRGGRPLHAVEKVLFNDQVSLENLDSPLVAPGSPSLLNFHNRLPRMRGGVHFNLYNNVWGSGRSEKIKKLRFFFNPFSRRWMSTLRGRGFSL